MAETTILKSPRPTRAQIWAVFGRDPDFAKKVEKIFDDLIAAAEAANANAAELEEVKLDGETTSALVNVAMGLVVQAADLAELAEQQANSLSRLNARMTKMERAISDLEQAPIP